MDLLDARALLDRPNPRSLYPLTVVRTFAGEINSIGSIPLRKEIATFTFCMSNEEMEKTAHLFAAAPEMADALEALASHPVLELMTPDLKNKVLSALVKSKTPTEPTYALPPGACI